MKSYYMCGRLAEPSRVKDSMEVNFSNTAMYRQTNGHDAGIMSSLFGDARALLLYRIFSQIILILHSSCLRNSCVLKYSGMGSSYLAITL